MIPWLMFKSLTLTDFAGTEYVDASKTLAEVDPMTPLVSLFLARYSLARII